MLNSKQYSFIFSESQSIYDSFSKPIIIIIIIIIIITAKVI